MKYTIRVVSQTEVKPKVVANKLPIEEVINLLKKIECDDTIVGIYIQREDDKKDKEGK